MRSRKLRLLPALARLLLALWVPFRPQRLQLWLVWLLWLLLSATVALVLVLKFFCDELAKAPSGAFVLARLESFQIFSFRYFTAVLTAVVLGGCASKSLLSEVTSSLIEQQFGSSDDALSSVKLNPAYQYLRVQAVGQPAALLVLGYVDAHPDGDIEVWYSASHEVIKTQNGRIVATAGLVTDWTLARYLKAPPSWNDQLSHDATFTRVRDEMPGYRFNLADQLVQSRLTEGLPAISLPSSLPATVAARFVWVREAQVGATPILLPPAWYALERVDGRYHVAYSYQCLSQALCLNLQRWPLPKAAL